MTWPVGVGFTSSGPTGALGLTITIGRPFWASLRATALRPPLGGLVVARKLAGLHRRGFIGGLAGRAAERYGQADATNGAGIDDARTAGLRGGVRTVAGAFDIRLVHGRVVLEPEVVAGRGVETPVTARASPGPGFSWSLRSPMTVSNFTPASPR